MEFKIEDHISTIEVLAARSYRSRFYSNVEFCDLFQAGAEGFLQARLRFDPFKGVKFKTYSQYRINGSILDFLRGCTFGNKRTFCNIQTDSITDSAVSKKLTYSENYDILLIRLDLQKALLRLSKKEQLIVIQHYWFSRSLDDISIELKVSASRVSQILTGAKKKLFKLLRGVYK